MLHALDYFEHPKLLVGNAREHLDRLKIEEKAFFDRKPYTLVVSADANTGHKVYKARLTFRLPGKIPVVLFDVFSNLRAALDQAMCASIISIRGPRVSIKRTYFPFADGAGDLQEAMRERCKKVPAEIKTLVKGFKPYKGGNNLLWAFNRLSATNRHQNLLEIAATADLISIHATSGQIIPQSPVWDRAKNELEFARASPDAELENDFDLPFFCSVRRR